jgi:hypothetical protein
LPALASPRCLPMPRLHALLPTPRHAKPCMPHILPNQAYAHHHPSLHACKCPYTAPPAHAITAHTTSAVLPVTAAQPESSPGEPLHACTDAHQRLHSPAPASVWPALLAMATSELPCMPRHSHTHQAVICPPHKYHMPTITCPTQPSPPCHTYTYPAAPHIEPYQSLSCPVHLPSASTPHTPSLLLPSCKCCCQCCATMCQVQSPHVVVQCWPPCPPCCAVPRCNTACAATCHQPLHARPCFPIHSAMPPNQACMHCQVLLSCCTLPPTCARHGSLAPTTPSSHLLPPTVVVMSTTCPACHATCTARPATMPVTSHPVCPRTHGGPRCTGHHGLSYSHQHTHSRMASGMVSNHTDTP